MFDVDDTLVKWSPTPEEIAMKGITMEFTDVDGNVLSTKIVPHSVHVEQLKKHKIRKHTIGVWSAGGSLWAKEAVKALGLEPYVDFVISKPTWCYDDKTPNEYIPPSQYIKDTES
jgi:FMN phosphatase YigB (HAD superfamily)